MAYSYRINAFRGYLSENSYEFLRPYNDKLFPKTSGGQYTTGFYFDLGQKIDLDKDVLKEKIRKTISDKYEQLPYWVKVQLDFLV